jgi:hypothetical protein
MECVRESTFQSQKGYTNIDCVHTRAGFLMEMCEKEKKRKQMEEWGQK